MNKTINPVWLVTGVLWTLLMAWVSLQPGSTYASLPVPLFCGADKILHFLMFGILGYIWTRGLGNTLLIATIVIVLSIIFGAAIEMMQMWVIDRYGSLSDQIANTAGVLCGALSAALPEQYHIQLVFKPKTPTHFSE